MHQHHARIAFEVERTKVNVEWASTSEPQVAAWAEMPITMREMIIGVFYAGHTAGIEALASSLRGSRGG